MLFLMTFWAKYRNSGFRKKYVFPKEKQWFSRFGASIFHVFSMFFRSVFGIDFCIDFFMVLGSILAPFSIPLRPFGTHFGILFGYWFFNDFLMSFWTIFGPRSRERTGIPSITFFIIFLVFSWSRSGGRFSWILDRFLMDFHGFWDNFGVIFTSFLELVRYCLHPFPYRFNTFDKGGSRQKAKLLERPFR